GGVWSAAATKVHADQLAHVKKGCLSRTHQDLQSDGSHIEGLHKGWNSLMRSFLSDIEMFTALGHDFVHRCNICISINSGNATPFIKSTYRSHHLQLISSIASQWNTLVSKEPTTSITCLWPVLPTIECNKMFGLIHSPHSTMFGGLLSIKEEEDPGADSPQDLLDRTCNSNIELASILQDLNIDPTLLYSAIQSFFTSHKPLADSTSVKVQTGSLTVPTTMTASVSSLCTLLPNNNKQGLTWSQQLFHICSGIDPRSLIISSDAEYYLFMDMRLEYKWTTFGINSHKWVQATNQYNTRLQQKFQHKGPIVKKSPRALLDKLGEMEGHIIERVKSNNFACKCLLVINTT
ncbi:hypothetical protein SERLA73DRAFT_50137, partial [Serpula lacrymans var. lacrymans S7.3]